MNLQEHRGGWVWVGFVLADQGTLATKQGTGYLSKVAGPWEGSAWVSMRDVRAGRRGAGDTSLSMPQHVETYMFSLHLGVCTLKFPSPVLGGWAKGLSLMGLIGPPLLRGHQAERGLKFGNL